MTKIKFNIGKDKISFSKGDGKLTQPIEPPHQVCEVCNDDGGCLNNINHKDYEKNNSDDSFYGGTDLYDCADYSNVLDGLPKGQWMIDWARALQKKSKEPKEPSSFAKWNRSLKNPQ